MDNARMEWKEKINAAREELKTAGKIHRRDLIRHIHRMEKELKLYDMYRAGVRNAQ